jgi:multiple sugar transport system ATP-binding protein
VQVSRTHDSGFIPVEAHIIEPLGPYDIVDLKFGQKLVRARTPSGYVDKAGDVVYARFDEKQTHFFSTRTGESLHIRFEA